MVIDALKGVEPDRKCFRMIGGVLVERTVKDVLPALVNNRQQVRILCTVRGGQLSSQHGVGDKLSNMSLCDWRCAG